MTVKEFLFKDRDFSIFKLVPDIPVRCIVIFLLIAIIVAFTFPNFVDGVVEIAENKGNQYWQEIKFGDEYANIKLKEEKEKKENLKLIQYWQNKKEFSDIFVKYVSSSIGDDIYIICSPKDNLNLILIMRATNGNTKILSQLDDPLGEISFGSFPPFDKDNNDFWGWVLFNYRKEPVMISQDFGMSWKKILLKLKDCREEYTCL